MSAIGVFGSSDGSGVVGDFGTSAEPLATSAFATAFATSEPSVVSGGSLDFAMQPAASDARTMRIAMRMPIGVTSRGSDSKRNG